MAGRNPSKNRRETEEQIRKRLENAIARDNRVSIQKILRKHPGHREIERIYREGKEGLTPLMQCWRNLHLMSFILRQGYDVNARGKTGLTPLHYACKIIDEVDVVRLLCSFGADMEAVDNHLTRPLMMGTGNTNITRYLIIRGCDVKAKNALGNTALHIACREGDTGSARLIIAKGCDVNAMNTNDDTALHLACLAGHTEAAQLLIDNDCDVNAIAFLGDTALHLACRAGHTETARLLIDNGCDVNATNNDGFTALLLARITGHRETALMLVQHFAKIKNLSLQYYARHAIREAIIPNAPLGESFTNAVEGLFYPRRLKDYIK